MNAKVKVIKIIPAGMIANENVRRIVSAENQLRRTNKSKMVLDVIKAAKELTGDYDAVVAGLESIKMPFTQKQAEKVFMAQKERDNKISSAKEPEDYVLLAIDSKSQAKLGLNESIFRWKKSDITGFDKKMVGKIISVEIETDSFEYTDKDNKKITKEEITKIELA